MSDATREVTIKLNIVSGDIQKPDMSWLAAAKEEVNKLLPDMKSLAETTREYADSNKSLGQITKDTATSTGIVTDKNSILIDQNKLITESNKTIEASAKQTANVQIESSKRVIQTEKDAWAAHRDQKDKEFAAQKKQNDELTRQLTGGTGGTGGAEVEDRTKTNGELLKLNDQFNARTQADNETAATALIRTRTSLNNQRVKEEQAAAADAMRIAERTAAETARAEETAAAAMIRSRTGLNNQRIQEEQRVQTAAAAAAQQLPRVHQQITSGIMGSVAATAKLGLHLAMLSQSGQKDTEALAKKFVEIQAKIGLITETKQMFTGFSQTLGALTRAGALTQSMVASQQALGVATTFSQVATMRLAGAAATAQAAMGPIALIVMAITAAVAAASMIEDSYAESAEDIAKKKEEHLKRYDDLHKNIIKTMENEKLVMSEQVSLLNTQWEIKRLLLGDGNKMSVADQTKEIEEKRQLAQDQTGENFRLKLTEMQNSPERAEKEKALGVKLAEAEKEVENVGKTWKQTGIDILSWTTPLGLASKAIGKDLKNPDEFSAKQNVQNIMDEQKAMSFNQGDKQFEILKQTQFKDGKVVDQAKLDKDMSALPAEQQRGILAVLKGIHEDTAKQLAVDANALPKAERDLATAKANLPQLERDMIQNGRFGEEDRIARRMQTDEGKSARDQAVLAMNQLDAPGASVSKKERAANEAMKALQKNGVLSEDTKTELLQGSKASGSRVKDLLVDDAAIDGDEAKAANENYKKLKVLRDEAKDAVENMPALIQSLQDSIRKLAAVTDEQKRKSAVDNSI